MGGWVGMPSPTMLSASTKPTPPFPLLYLSFIQQKKMNILEKNEFFHRLRYVRKITKLM